MAEEFSACKFAYILNNKLLVYPYDDFMISISQHVGFPRGAREGDEIPEQCMLRELEEEFGIKYVGWGKPAPPNISDFKQTALNLLR